MNANHIVIFVVSIFECMSRKNQVIKMRSRDEEEEEEEEGEEGG